MGQTLNTENLSYMIQDLESCTLFILKVLRFQWRSMTIWGIQGLRGMKSQLLEEGWGLALALCHVILRKGWDHLLRGVNSGEKFPWKKYLRGWYWFSTIYYMIDFKKKGSTDPAEKVGHDDWKKKRSHHVQRLLRLRQCSSSLSVQYLKPEAEGR